MIFVHYPRRGIQVSINIEALFRDQEGRWVFVDEKGLQHADIEAVRAFPITDPMHGVSIRTKEGKEVAWIEDLESIAEPIRSLLEKLLQQKQFMPTITSIVRISRTAEPNEWEVETDRGPTKFPLRSEEDVLRFAGQRAMIIDAHGVRYLITNLQALDAQSRRLLERYL